MSEEDAAQWAAEIERRDAALWRIFRLLERAPGGMVAKISAEVEKAVGANLPKRRTIDKGS